MAKLETMFPLSFSNSSLSSFWSCEFKGYRSRIQFLRSPRETNGHLLAGGTFASACERARIDFYNNNLSQEEAVENAVEFILTQPDTGHEVKSNERLALTFRKYVQTFPFKNGFRPCKLEDGTHAIEYNFEIDLGIQHPDLPNQTIKYNGKLDGLYERVIDGKVVSRFVLDEKSTGRISRVKGTKVVDLEKEADIFRASSQLIGYSYAASLMGIEINSALIRRVPILTTYEPAFELEIPITKYMKDMWFISTYEKIRELIEKYKYVRDNQDVPAQSVFSPSYSGACNAYSTPCQFMPGCLYKEGEDMLKVTHIQAISIERNGVRETIVLKDYKKEVGIL